MEIQNNGNVRRAATYRQKREAAGETQVNVWLEERLREKLDSIVKTGLFKNRSELIAAALSQFELSQGNS